ncbi:homeobox and C2H2 transcription factor [Pochonia chlamydosporia 170]|uniref:Homeobox and C2H2 transcription factor n=1 Tax=Pochonia chlamydosporia 170 TaxID=1380566 RepID=A0A219ANW2_METCM|nr:homeobox and C2H2 transcription factor [Pochonia chlamydosporia 170]OWT42528.1 homeobox and C2H2 transcription factor [Pochonia chlamydosporia 170]
MDPSQNHQLQQPLSLQSTASSPSADASPQDVLAEARKNLQVLIDSGFSKDMLHQWVDDSLSLQHSNLPTSTLASTLSLPTTSPLAPQHDPPPPPPQCPPPPPPSAVPCTRTSAPAMMPTSAPPTIPSPGDIKAESMADEMSRNWPPAPTLGSNSNPMMPTMDRHTGSHMGNLENQMFFAAPSPAFSHRPRISISSVSSGSSGHASIWSTNSAQSSLSWQSGASARSGCPMPMPPQHVNMGMMHTSPVSPLNAGGASSAGSNANKQNIYWCTSCETSFKRKYDWKRHEDEFHERWRKYPCPEPGCNRSFWGSNSFNQHHKQCHGCKTCPHAEKVVKFLRKRKYWACGFCSALHPARERHVEHVARHFESGLSKGDWMHSRVVYGLLHQPLVREAWDRLVEDKRSNYGGKRPQFSWHPSKTGRAQGFLEKESPGQLQDLLEFFSGDETEANWVVGVAYELADIVMGAPPTATPPPQFANGPGSMGPPQHPPPFAPLPSQAHQQAPLLPPTSPDNQGAFGGHFQQGNVFLPSQPFGSPNGPSPDSSNQSPMTASQSPMGSSPMDGGHGHGHGRDMRQSTSNPGQSVGDGMMDYEYSSAPGSFNNWPANFAGPLSSSPASQHQSGPSHPDWNVLQYFSTDSQTASAGNNGNC